jgi:probable HAF family extracellular repeat protein
VRWTKRGRVWTIEKLPANTNDPMAATATDIAADGTIVGLRFNLNAEEQLPHATVWPVSGGIVDVGPGVALGVNPQGTVVGARANKDDSGPQAIQAVVWNRISARTWAPGQLLPRLPNGHASEALGINPAGSIIAGHAWDSEDIEHAVKWVLVGGQWQGPIRLSESGDNAATLVNASGDIAGGGVPCGIRGECQYQAMFWPAHGARLDLGTLGVFLSVNTPIGLSNSGEVVGLALTPDFEQYAYLWRPAAGTVVNLGHLIGDDSSIATDINGHHQVVGGSLGPLGGHAIVWTPR